MDPQLFEKNHYENSVEDMIRYMAEKLVALGIAPEAFTDSVLERGLLPPPVLTTKWQSHIPSSALPKKILDL